MTADTRHRIESYVGPVNAIRSLHGGSINDCYRIDTIKGSFFCKTNAASKFPQLFSKERSGIETLRANHCTTPAVITDFIADDEQVLLMEWIFQESPDRAYWIKLGETIAALHQASSDQFGFSEDNYMGSVPQENQALQNWPAFFMQRRLIPLINKCRKDLGKASIEKFEKLFKKLDEIYPAVRPSLVHGDLWDGNLLCRNDLIPVLIDPAVYYGHPSIDIGMTKLFGGFDPIFMEAYRANMHTDPNFEEQCEVSNLYPLLIHLYLFGGHYRQSIVDIVNKFAG